MISRPNIKINLGLNVLRKRTDSFHDIQTLFLPDYSFRDTLEIIAADDFSKTSAALFAKYGPVPECVPEDYVPNIAQSVSPDGKLMITIAKADGVGWEPLKDLTARAYYLLSEDFELPSVKIFLEKTSPVGAGLGGGSADAAFALKMYNELFSLALSDEKLADCAARLGSDCAFFIYNKAMIGEGRGEILRQHSLDLSDYDIHLIVPEGIAVSTAEAYSGIVPKEPELSFEEVLARPVGDWKGLLVNDFEETVFKKHPELAAIKQSLYDSGAVYASMSGSGSALFGIYHRL